MLSDYLFIYNFFFNCNKVSDTVFVLLNLCWMLSGKKERYCDAWIKCKLSLLQKEVKRIKLCIKLTDIV